MLDSPDRNVKLTRRDFLKLGEKGLIAAIIWWFFGNIPPSTPLPPDIRTKLPEDILSDEELRQAHITINNTPDVQLHLRKSAWEIPLIRDCFSGKVKRLMITLVDGAYNTWEATDKMPEEPKRIWELLKLHPKDFPDEYWEKEKPGEFQRKKDLEAQIVDLNSQYGQIDDDKKFYEEEIKEDNDLLRNNPNFLDYFRDVVLKSIGDNEEKLRILQATEKSHREEIDLQIKQTQTQLDTLSQELSREKLISEKIKYDDTNINDTGRMYVGLSPDKEYDDPIVYKRKQQALQDEPELNDTIFIFIAVGGEHKPNPQISFVSPEALKDPKTGLPRVGDPDSQGYILNGLPQIALRHEMGHYNPDDPSNNLKEPVADRQVIDYVTEAWKKFAKNGDTSGYSIVFQTKEGIMIAKNTKTTTNI